MTAQRVNSRRIATRQPLYQEIANLIKQDIVDGHFAPGERVVESRLAQEMQVSLTPVREAVRQLIGEGVLTTSPNRGPSVRILSEADAFELYSLRAMLEGLAARLIVDRKNREQIQRVRGVFQEMEDALDEPAVESLLPYSSRLHGSLIAASEHARLRYTYHSLEWQIALLNRVAGQVSTKQHEVDWHRPIVEAIEGTDPELAERVIRRHIHESYLVFMDMVGKPGMTEGWRSDRERRDELKGENHE